MQKILIIRFSSFGDVVQSLSAVASLKKKFPESQIDFLTRSDFKALLEINPFVSKIWAIKKGQSLVDLISLVSLIKKENYEIVYDAHRNLRSFFVRFFLLGFTYAFFPDLFISTRFITRPKERIKRLLLFKFRINLFPRPYKGAISYLTPLKIFGEEFFFVPQSWNFSAATCQQVVTCLAVQAMRLEETICLAPSAAWDMKRWPIDHYKALIKLLPHRKFIILGGREDSFAHCLKEVAPERVLSLIGQLSLIESCYVVSQTALLISADTGLLHVADILGKKAIALIGPTAFGHTSGEWVKECSINLDCRPCSKDGRGKCSQSIYQKCMVDINPQDVAKLI